MKIRSTEKPHQFSDVLYKSIPLYELQGLTLDTHNEFSAGVEAVEFDKDEIINLNNIFPKEQWIAKIYLCNSLSVPLYLLTHKDETNFINIYEVNLYIKDNKKDVQFISNKKIKLENFANWWRILKGTKQTKPLYEAGPRAQNIFDDILFKNDTAWGGNVDGFTLNNQLSPSAIIETRYTTKNPLERYDPAIYFRGYGTRAGDYKTWEPLVLLASKLKIPLFLFTFERKKIKNRIGFSVIEYISKDKLNYQDNPPFENIVNGVENIKNEIRNNLSKKPPRVI